ncbi:2-ketogluconate reductase [Pontibacillus halophilus JSM 076056 = DSM 19796]|uniref:2-ketogluconate reductase n=1 Tax=Pontibacillus halophilus JSM 076056 = DSM 19796 TaxID=1385510 RepID=A0A0A5GC92_9BACI|nr:D-glycerate dehydrogenase [Pontibacillus halophilus]KGX89629.1 2-ketogluconate reductase [Pontibacillus halophilus JSM 076056 = DSM 19796]
MNKPAIYITRQLPESVIAPYRNILDIEMWSKSEQPVDASTLMDKAQQVDGLVTMLSDQVSSELLGTAKGLKAVANLAVGFDNIDLTSAEENEVVVTNTPDVLTETTADLTFALMLATARRIVEAADYVRNDEWKNWAPYLLAGTDVHHKTIGIVGMGRIGEAVAQRAKGFNMNILYHNRSRNTEAEQALQANYATFEELLIESDYVVCLAPYTEETHEMFNTQAFQKMKDTAIFINASRGKNVDEEALYDALVAKEIKAAGVDVYRQEPIRASHPLLSLDNVVALPHIGSSSEETRTAMIQLCLDNLIELFNGNVAKTPVTEKKRLST